MKSIFVFAIAFNVFLLNVNSANVQRRQAPDDEANAILLLALSSVEGITNSGLEFVKQLSTTLTDNSAVVEAISDTESAQTQLLTVAASLVPTGQLPALTIPDLDTVPTSVANAILEPVVSYWLTLVNLLFEPLLDFTFLELPQNLSDAVNNLIDNQNNLIGLLQDQSSPANVQKRQASPTDLAAIEGIVEPPFIQVVNGVQQIFLQLASLIPSDSAQAQIFADTALSYEQLISNITDSLPPGVPTPSLPALTIPGLSSLDSTQVQTILTPIVIFLFNLLSPLLMNFNLIPLPENVINSISQVITDQNLIIDQL